MEKADPLSSPEHIFLKPPMVAARYGVTLQTVDNWRRSGSIPAPIMFNGTKPRWRLSTLMAWENEQEATSHE